MRSAIVISLFGLAGFAVMPAARGDVLNAGEVLEIHFSTSAPVCPFGECDTLVVYPNEQGAFFATDMTANLYDGATLLGTYFNPSCCLPLFQSSSSVFTEGTTVDFTGMDSGTIDGILDISIATGSLTWPSAPTPQLLLGHATGTGLVWGGTGLQITSVTILPVPEPSTLATLLGMLVLLVFRSFHRGLPTQFHKSVSS